MSSGFGPASRVGRWLLRRREAKVARRFPAAGKPRWDGSEWWPVYPRPVGERTIRGRLPWV